jgi:hypothetical protein
MTDAGNASKMLVYFYEATWQNITEGRLALCPKPKLEYHPMSAVRNCLFSMFVVTLYIWRASPFAT